MQMFETKKSMEKQIFRERCKTMILAFNATFVRHTDCFLIETHSTNQINSWSAKCFSIKKPFNHFVRKTNLYVSKSTHHEQS